MFSPASCARTTRAHVLAPTCLASMLYCLEIRYGMVLWCLFAVSFAAKTAEQQHQHHQHHHQQQQLVQLLASTVGVCAVDTADLSSGAAAGGCYWTRLPNGQLVSASLMVVYIAKFFHWEKWYLHAADIQVSVR